MGGWGVTVQPSGPAHVKLSYFILQQERKGKGSRFNKKMNFDIYNKNYNNFREHIF